MALRPGLNAMLIWGGCNRLPSYPEARLVRQYYRQRTRRFVGCVRTVMIGRIAKLAQTNAARRAKVQHVHGRSDSDLFDGTLLLHSGYLPEDLAAAVCASVSPRDGQRQRLRIPLSS